ncbi:MAG: nucleotide pyrophosphohydrolase [Desulfobulbaceae bacterium]|nr:nucleotide pyrophosphohydrolase [Desulfobulbaceae bacterium]
MSSAEISRNFTDLYEIITRLRGPDGCPWDRKQSPESITKYLLEETGELAEAISRRDEPHVCEEVGDLFYILLLIIRMYEEQGHFTAEEVLSGIAAKMVRRHPHVFAGTKTGNDRELKQQWEAIKKQEKRNP